MISFESIVKQLGGTDVLKQLGASVNASPEQVKKVAQLGLPTLMEAMNRNTNDKKGAAPRDRNHLLSPHGDVQRFRYRTMEPWPRTTPWLPPEKLHLRRLPEPSMGYRGRRRPGHQPHDRTGLRHLSSGGGMERRHNADHQL